jgi:hypothetical protein
MGISDFKHPADGTHIFDDFLGNSAVADATIGTVRWEMTTIGNASTPTFVASQNGIMRITTAGTADGDGEAFTTHPDGIVLSGSNQWFRGRFRYPTITGNQLAGNNFRFGFSASVTATEPAVGVWIDSDAGVLSFDVASTNGDISAAAAGVSTLTSGTTMVIDTWHDLEVQMDGTNANGGPDRIRFFVDGELAAEIKNVLLGSAETMEFGLVHWQDTGGAATLELDVDYVEAWLPRN